MLIREVGQDGEADVVLGKSLRVLPETELLKPVSDLLHRASAPRLSGFARLHRQVYLMKARRSRSWSPGVRQPSLDAMHVRLGGTRSVLRCPSGSPS